MIVNAIDDLPRRIMARRKSTKVELVKLYRRDYKRGSTASGGVASGGARQDNRGLKLSEAKEEGAAKDLDMEIAHSTSHNSLQSHEDTKVRVREETKGVMPSRPAPSSQR